MWRSCLIALPLLVGCGRAPVEVLAEAVPAPAPEDRGEICADMGDVRACWGAALTGPAPRPLPEVASASGWRCQGQGEKRTCAPRAARSPPFECDERLRCVQALPRLPDDGEWDCADVEGVVRCVGGQPAAGTVAGPPDPGWLCGARLGTVDQRVCVDLSPDEPEPGRDLDPVDPARRWKCSYDRGVGLARVCVPAPGPTKRLGARCADAPECPQGATCAGGRCLPPRPTPACWLDGDCGPGGACRFGTCGTKAR